MAITVDTTLDVVDANDGLTSLREAIAIANAIPGSDTIDFAEALTAEGPATILMEHGEFASTESIIIHGPGAELLTIDAQQQSRIFNFTEPEGVLFKSGDCTVTGLTLTGGQTTGDDVVLPAKKYSGGAIRMGLDGILTVAECVIAGNRTLGSSTDGGAIFVKRPLSSSSQYGLVLMDSVVSQNQSAHMGGGLAAARAITIINSIVSGNQSSTGGGIGVGEAQQGTLTVQESTIKDNIAIYGGGGVYAPVVAITDSFVLNNSTTGQGGRGGGINAASSATITGSVIAENWTTEDSGEGGGVYLKYNGLIQDSVVRDNYTLGFVASGGGVASTFGDVTVERSLITGNSTAGNGANGGGISAGQNMQHSAIVIDSTIARNRILGTGYGGGIYSADSATIVQCTISENEADLGWGGGVLSRGPGAGVFDQTTVTANSAMIAGGVFGVRLTNSIVSGNSATLRSPDAESSALLSHNLLGSVGHFNIPHDEAPVGAPDILGNLIGGPINGAIDPMLGPLAYNGGPVFLDGSRMLTHALLPGSPAIGAGDPALNEPIADYRFEEAAGAIIVKDSLGANDGEYHGEPASGQTGSPLGGGAAVAFDGIDDYVTVPASVSNDFSLSFWVYTKQKGSGRIGLIDADPVDSSSGFGVYVEDEYLVFRIGDSIINSNAQIWIGNWHHIAVTRDATTGAGSVYMDGAKYASILTEVTGALTNVSEWQIGQLFDGTGHFVGSMGELVVYDRVLNAAEIQQQATAGALVFDQRGEAWSRVVGGRIDMGAVEFQANPLAGDYNFNGVVDAADYSVWRDTFGSANDMRADGSGPTEGVPDGVVDELDYAFWKSNFGNVLEQGAGSSAAAIDEIAGELRLAGAVGSSSGLASIGSAVSVDEMQQIGETNNGDLRSDAVRGLETRAQHRGPKTHAQQNASAALVGWLAARTQYHSDVERSDPPILEAIPKTSEASLACDAALELLGRDGLIRGVFRQF